MFSFGSKNKKKRSSGSNAQRELQKLKRQDLLELLLDQMRENDQLRAQIATQQEEIDGLDILVARLKARLDDKDRLLESLFACARDMVDLRSPRRRMEMLLEMEGLLTAHNVRQAAGEEPEADFVAAEPEFAAEPELSAEFEAEPELDPEPEEEADAEFESEEAPEAVPSPEVTPEPSEEPVPEEAAE